MCVHLPGMSLYFGVSACIEKSLLIFKTGLNDKLSFGSAEFTIDVYTCCAQGTQGTLQADRKAKLLSWNTGKGMRREPGKDPPQVGVTQGKAKHYALFLKV